MTDPREPSAEQLAMLRMIADFRLCAPTVAEGDALRALIAAYEARGVELGRLRALERDVRALRSAYHPNDDQTTRDIREALDALDRAREAGPGGGDG